MIHYKFIEAYQVYARVRHRRECLAAFAAAWSHSLPEAVSLMRVAVEAENYAIRLQSGFSGRLRSSSSLIVGSATHTTFIFEEPAIGADDTFL